MVGNLTRFDYLRAFRTYKELAEELGKTIRGREIIKTWNDIVFRGIGLKDDDPPVENLDPANSLLQRLRERAQEETEIAATNGGGSRSNN